MPTPKFFLASALAAALLAFNAPVHAQAAPSAIIFLHGTDPNYRASEVSYRSHDCKNYFARALPYFNSKTSIPTVTFGMYDKSTNCTLLANNANFNRAGATRDTHFGFNSAQVGGGDKYAFSTDKSIRHLGYRLAWYIHKNYTSQGRSVSIVAHSMGGLVARYAVGQSALRHPDFPGPLQVRSLVMFGTPNGGSGIGSLCSGVQAWAQCAEMGINSRFLADLNGTIDRGNSGVARRVTMNTLQSESTGFDGVAYDSNDIVGTQVRYFSPTYGHGDYQLDVSDLANARISYSVVRRDANGQLQRSNGTSTTAERAMATAYRYAVLSN